MRRILMSVVVGLLISLMTTVLAAAICNQD